MLTTPFSENFYSLTFEITPTLIQDGYVLLIKIPDLTTISVVLGGCNDILDSAYEVLEITEDNYYMYSSVEIGSWVLSWISHSSSSSSGYNESSSSSSSDSSTFELKDLIECGLYSTMNIKYISTT